MTVIIERSELSGLAMEVAGPVTLPGDDEYAAETATWNLSAAQRPVVAIGATSAPDVRAAVRFAAERGLPITVVSTGHGAVRGSDGSVLDQRSPDERHPDRRGGAHGDRRRGRRGAAPGRGHRRDRAGAAGRLVAQRGVVGYTLGGGLSPTLGRAYGYSADHVRAFEIVTADGELRRVDAEHEPELFWAVRGGKGNFGVVTALTVDLVPVNRLYAGGLYFAAEHTEQGGRRVSPADRCGTGRADRVLRLPAPAAACRSCQSRCAAASPSMCDSRTWARPPTASGSSPTCARPRPP